MRGTFFSVLVRSLAKTKADTEGMRGPTNLGKAEL